MSFILDALRKSEHARQKTTGPGLAEVPVAAPKPKANVWATAAVALLVVNLVAVGVLLLRRASVEAPPTSAATVTSTSAAPTTTPVAAPAVAPAATRRSDAANPTLAPAARTPVAARPATGARNPLAEELGESSGGVDPEFAAGAASVPAGPPAVSRQGAPRRGTVTYAPVPEAADAPYSPPRATAAPAVEALPAAADMVASGVPALHLDLHVYAPSPQQRFIFVNSRKYREGDTLQEGPVVERITPEGAVMTFRGNRFRLAND
jgi:general secretion pathway protein B